MRLSLLLVFALVATGCVTASPTYASLPRERTNECVQACQKLGLHMTAVVVMGNSVGCVCEPEGANTSTTQKGASAAAGGTVVLQQQQQQRQQQQFQQSTARMQH
jgi:hypothetical protein